MRIPASVRRPLSHLWWLFPILLGVWLFVPVLRARVFLDAIRLEDQVSLLIGIIVQGVLGGAWLMYEFFAVSNQQTSVHRLRVNNAVSTAMALAFTVIGTWLLARDMFMWGLIVPWSAALLDAFVSSDRAINNAAQKPLVQQEPRGHGNQ
jgi:hypothetical protein